MQLKIIEKKEKPLLSRTEVTAELAFEKAATPSKEQIIQQLASTLSADQKLIVIKKVNTSFGSTQADVTAYVYSDEKSMKSIEPKPKAKPKAKPAEEKPEEKKEKEKPEEKAEKPAEEAK